MLVIFISMLYVSMFICAPSVSAFMHLVCLGPYEISVFVFFYLVSCCFRF